jgi:hypothetical protein
MSLESLEEFLLREIDSWRGNGSLINWEVEL